MAEALRTDLGADVEVVDGGRGEFTVSVDGREVARKEDNLPPVGEVVAAVRQANAAHTGAGA